MQILKDVANSKKAWAFVASLIASFIAVNLGLDEAVVLKLIEAIMVIGGSYMVGQGIADHGKEAEKVRWAVDMLKDAAKEAAEAARDSLNKDQPDA